MKRVAVFMLTDIWARGIVTSMIITKLGNAWGCSFGDFENRFSGWQVALEGEIIRVSGKRQASYYGGLDLIALARSYDSGFGSWYWSCLTGINLLTGMQHCSSSSSRSSIGRRQLIWSMNGLFNIALHACISRQSDRFMRMIAQNSILQGRAGQL